MTAATAAEALIGRHVLELETPLVVVDLDVLEANIARAAAYAELHGLALWPHLKTHKTVEVAARQRAAGAVGFTVAKSREAELFAAAGFGPLLRATRDAFTAAGIDCARVSGGSTATLQLSHETCMTEVRAGNYVFLDRSEARGGWRADDAALRVHASVVSTAVPGRMVLDAGSKTLGEAGPPAGLTGWGRLVTAPAAEVVALNEEHAVCVLPEGASARAGDRHEVVPNHGCTCANLHDLLVAARGGVVEEVWPLIARGEVR